MHRKAKYEDRAKRIHGTKYKEQKIPEEIDQERYWKENVHSKEDAEKYFQLFYPMLPEQVQKAYADYFDRAVRGEITLPDNYIRKEYDGFDYTKWDYKKELEDQKIIGKINLTTKRLDELLNE